MASRGTISCDTDVIAWAKEQARLLRAGDFAAFDVEHIADEVEDVGKSEQRELESRMALLMCHLLKWQFQAGRRGASWQKTIAAQREGLELRLKRTPSLKASLTDPDWLRLVWIDAVDQAERKPDSTFFRCLPVGDDRGSRSRFHARLMATARGGMLAPTRRLH